MKRLTQKEQYAVYERVKSHPGDVKRAKDWADAARRVGAEVGLDIPAKTIARVATALEIKPDAAPVTPVSLLWEKVRTLEAEVAALKAEGCGR